MRILGFEITRAKKPQARFLGDLTKIDLKPGDVCVLMARESMSAARTEAVAGAWRAAVGDEVTLLLLDGGARLGVLSPPQAAEVTQRIEAEQAVEEAIAG